MSVENKKAYEDVIEYIKREILSGRLCVGDRLAPERVIAERLSVSRTSVREAVRSLEILGVLQSIQGAGNFIAANADKSFNEIVSIMFLLQMTDGYELAELRNSLDAMAANLAVKSITDEQVMYLEELCDKMRSASDESCKAAADKELHYTIAKASGNRALLIIINALSDIYNNFVVNIRRDILSEGKNQTRLQKIHEDLVAALRIRDEKAVSAATYEHFLIIDEYIFRKKDC